VGDDGFNNFTTKHRREWYAINYNQRRHSDLLQGLGSEECAAHRVSPRLASFVGRLDVQMLFFLANGYRVVAHDWRGHGRSSQVSTGHDMDHYASDASAVVEHLDLRNAIHIGHSTGGGEVARFVAKYGEPQNRVAKAVLIASVPPLMLKTEKNPGGTPIEVFDGSARCWQRTGRSFFSISLRVRFTALTDPAQRPCRELSRTGGVRE
jgi:pimeloyl-ACP methyl ester carboxylesterase